MSDRKNFVTTWFYSRVEVNKEIKTGLLGGVREQHTANFRQVDIDDLSNKLEEAYNDYDRKGYDVVNVVPIQMGTSESCNQRNGTYVGEAAFSITRGVIVVAKLR
ncbi:hypothetical protein [Acetobacter indonesiensis]|uniref:Uncharacterized protein n=1 Tax=Acetobacter indonesiensis TaxID=104101 RepID=A0A252ANQ2_9PROT|nr:hypothetical protein [Acetobacter indonesiensis]OUI91426.1 hypothetical protein HK17_11575 [Acetobacter indonesiensis]